jgi:TonB family protein
MKPTTLLTILATTCLAGTAQAQQLPRLISWPVRYHPKALQDHGATVVLQFIVSASGRVDTMSIQVVRSTDPRFNEAARLTAISLTYDPARSKGSAVQLLVQQAITFESDRQGCAFTITPLVQPLCVDSTPWQGGP